MNKSVLFYGVKLAVYIIIGILTFIMFYSFFGTFYTGKSLHISVSGTDMGARPLEVYYLYNENEQYSTDNMKGFDSADVSSYSYTGSVILPRDGVKYVMLQLGDSSSSVCTVKDLSYKDSMGYADISNDVVKQGTVNDLELIFNEDGSFTAKATGADPYIVFSVPALTPYKNLSLPLAVLGVLVTLFVLNRYVKIKSVVGMATDLYQSRRLIMSLAINDFKTRYAGSYFGIIWAFVQPVCTILVFWFVFQVGFRSNDVGDVAFILWFIAGLIPWFFFSDGWNSATSSLIEYSYLVKKVVFKVHILPLVKIISALFVHLFFVVFMFAFYLIYGESPSIYWLQIFYYSVAMILLVIALSYITSALMVFFKDLGQIMNIVLQFGMWLTPIMWSIDMIPSSLMWLFKLNPMYYVVQGYRDSLIYEVPFYNNIKQTLYFWIVMLVLMLVGSILYKKLKPHFADVL